jgi:hypothetical protein
MTSHGARMNTVFRQGVALTFVWASIAVPTLAGRAPEQAARHFTSPEEAVKVLIDTTKAGNVDDLIAIFGADGKALIASADPATARQNRQVFVVATNERWRLEEDGPNRKTLVIGNEDWPFPVPLVKDAKGWRFDTAAGKEEIIARRIGRNELETIETCHAYVTAQVRYAADAHDGNAAGAYAPKFQSDPGKEDGLYWPIKHGQKRSPLGELVAKAAEEGRPVGGDPAQQSAFHGYYFKILMTQGAAAPGGAKPYVVNGRMTGGFALVAWPAQYNVTGVMTFIVGQDGIVRQKDLGPTTDAVARKLMVYNPDSTWRPADE